MAKISEQGKKALRATLLEIASGKRDHMSLDEAREQLRTTAAKLSPETRQACKDALKRAMRPENIQEMCSDIGNTVEAILTAHEHDGVRGLLSLAGLGRDDMKLIPAGYAPVKAAGLEPRYTGEFAELHVDVKNHVRPFKVEISGRDGNIDYSILTEAIIACSWINPVLYAVHLSGAQQYERWWDVTKISITRVDPNGRDTDLTARVWTNVKPVTAKLFAHDNGFLVYRFMWES